MSKPHGQYCHICEQYRANEKFSAGPSCARRGHAAYVCKDCARRGNQPPDAPPEPSQFADERDYLRALIESKPPKQRHRSSGKARLIRASQERQAAGFLKRLLADGAVSEVKILIRATEVGLSREALLKAKDALGIVIAETESGSAWSLAA